MTTQGQKSGVAYTSFGRGRDGNYEIKVELRDGTWMTVHTLDGKPNPDIIGMFGTHELASPWSEETDHHTVVEELSVRNPNAKVS